MTDVSQPFRTWSEEDRLRYIRSSANGVSGMIATQPLLLLVEELERALGRIRALEQQNCPRCDGHTGVCLNFEDWDVVQLALERAGAILVKEPSS